MMQKLNNEVFVPDCTPVSCSQRDMDALIAQALENRSGKCRILLHQNPENQLHQMLIVQKQGNYIQPHIKRDSEKYYCVLHGQMLAVTFDHNGNVAATTELGSPDSGRDFLYRVDRATFHTFVAQSGCVCYLETVMGPFTKTEFAPWAPAPDNPGLSAGYLAKLLSRKGVSTQCVKGEEDEC